MAIITDTDNPGLIPGMIHGVTGSAVGCPERIIYTKSDPDGMTAALGSQIAQGIDDELYMCETDGNVDWIHLISGT